MSTETLAGLILIIARFFIYVIIADSLLSFVLPPYHSIREALDRIVDPFLNPIRSIMPQGGMIDFSPLILIILIEILSRLLATILYSM